MNYIRLQNRLKISYNWQKKKLLWNSRICNLHKARSMDFRFLQNMQFSNMFLFETNIWIQKQVLVSGKNHIKTPACKVTISDSFIILPSCHSIFTRTVNCWRLLFFALLNSSKVFYGPFVKSNMHSTPKLSAGYNDVCTVSRK